MPAARPDRERPGLGHGARLPQGENPARWRGHLETCCRPAPGPPVEHHAALPYAELPAFWRSCAARPASRPGRSSSRS